MNYSFRNLHVNVSLNLAPISLVAEAFPHSDLEGYLGQLSAELTELRLTVIEYSLGPKANLLKKKWMMAVQQQLVAMSDQLNHYLFRKRKIWATSPYAYDIRSSYISGIAMIEDLLEELATRFGHYYSPTVKITDFRLRNVLPELRHLASKLKLSIEQAGISSELAAIVNTGLSNVLNISVLTVASERYLRELVAEFEALELLDDMIIEQLLIKMDFNLPSFLLKKVDDLERALEDIHGLHDQVEKIIQQKQELRNIRQGNGVTLLAGHASYRDEMGDYLNKKRKHLEELMDVRRSALKDKAEMEDIFRMKTELPVEQMALLVRMMQAKGVIVKKEIGEVFNFFARYFYTDRALFISARNMLKKSTEVHFSTALKLWQLLESCMDWLDELFSVRNYQRNLK